MSRTTLPMERKHVHYCSHIRRIESSQMAVFSLPPVSKPHHKKRNRCCISPFKSSFITVLLCVRPAKLCSCILINRPNGLKRSSISYDFMSSNTGILQPKIGTMWTPSFAVHRISQNQLFAESKPTKMPSSKEKLFFAQDTLGITDQPVNADFSVPSVDRPLEIGVVDFLTTNQSSRPRSHSSGGMDAYDAQLRAVKLSDQGNMKETVQEITRENNSLPQEQPLVEVSVAAVQPISNLDARVLESILNEGKLDVSTEEQVKTLLMAPRAVDREAFKREVKNDGRLGREEYKSQFVSKISDDSFWNSIKAKAVEVIDSVQIYIENRIERDTQTLAAIGMLTVDRIQRDLSRALPAAGRQVKKLLLASNSTFGEKLLLALPSESSMISPKIDCYDELTTPADEVKQVIEAIRDILAGKSLPSVSSASALRRGVRSLAPAGTARLAERQQQAYQARKRTVLKREREGMDQTLGRVLGSVSDATWELKQEIRMGPGREAGYMSKGVRKALAAGALHLLEEGRRRGTMMLSEGSRKTLIGDEGNNLVMGYTNILDVTSIEEEEIINDVINEKDLEYAPDGLLSPQSFLEEKDRLISSLESCLSNPGKTWLVRDVVSKATENGITLDSQALRKVISSMVSLRDELREEIKEEDDYGRVYLKVEYVQKELRRMKKMVNLVTSLAVEAAGEEPANLLKSELEGFVLSDSIDEIIEIELERLEQLLADMVVTRERDIKTKDEYNTINDSIKFMYPVNPATNPESMSDIEENRMLKDVIVTEVISASFAAEANSMQKKGTHKVISKTMDQDFSQSIQSKVEIVTDEEYSDYKKQIKSIHSSEWKVEDEENNSKADNYIGKVILRIIDVLFLLGEKFLLVGLPSIITIGSNISSRYLQAQNRGNGYSGWKLLKNAKKRANIDV